MTDTPLVAISTCVKPWNVTARIHSANQRNVDAIAEIADCLPILMPAIGKTRDPLPVLDHISGLLLTGSPSNVHPENYGDVLAAPDVASDPARDATTLPLIRAAVARGVPVFALCRGMQELNVALGGTLHQFVHLLPGKQDHRSDRSRPPAERSGLSHPVRLVQGGVLQRLFDADEVMINSLHGQAVDRVAPGLVVEERNVFGPPTSLDLRAAGWGEALVLLAGATGVAGPITSPDGAVAEATVDEQGISVTVRCGQILDEVVLRSYCIGAAHMAWSWLTSEALAVDEEGDVHDLTVRSFGILRAIDTPPITIELVPDDGPAVNGSDAVFVAVAAAGWLRSGCRPDWPVGAII